MLILSIRTDKPEAEIGLYDGADQIDYHVWHAHRELSVTLHACIADLLQKHGKDWPDIEGIVCFQGPGSFTGLRIGLTVANALAYGLGVPIVAMQDPQWLERGITSLQEGSADQIALPHYGAEANITVPKR